MTSEGLSHVKIALPEIFQLLAQSGIVEGQVSRCQDDGTITLILPCAKPNTCVTLDIASSEPDRFLELVAEPPIELDAELADGPENYGDQMAAQPLCALPLLSHGPQLPRPAPVPVRVQFAHQVFQHFIGLKQYTIAHSMERAVRGQMPTAPGDDWKHGAQADPEDLLKSVGPLSVAEKELYDAAMFKMTVWINQQD